MLIKRVTIFLIIVFWFVFGLWNVLDLRLRGLFYQPVIGILPFVLLIAWSGWTLARYGSQKTLLANLLVFSFFGSLPFFLMGIQDQAVWHFNEQIFVWIQDFTLIFIASMIVGEVRIRFFKNALLPLPPSSEAPQIK
ncbi:hypothetical protein EPN15_03740 [Patescibacteria group bacterium]|nr:MAG: hypothetical protein EPN15_03740 [Patescibacteria group bacterium]